MNETYMISYYEIEYCKKKSVINIFFSFYSKRGNDPRDLFKSIYANYYGAGNLFYFIFLNIFKAKFNLEINL